MARAGHWIAAGAFVMAIALASCGNLQGPQGDGTYGVDVSSDQFSRDITVDGPEARINPLGGTATVWSLASYVNRDSHAVVHTVRVAVIYNSDMPVRFTNAVDDNARPLPLRVLRRSYGRPCQYCVRDEFYEIGLNPAAMLQKSKIGYDVKIFNAAGDYVIVPITSAMLTAQLWVTVRLAQGDPGIPLNGHVDVPVTGTMAPTR